MYSRYLTVNQVAKMFGVSRPQVKKWIEMGLKHKVQPNGFYEIDAEDLKRFLVKNKIKALARILIVDDDLEFATILSDSMEKKGFSTIISLNIADAFIKASNFNPDLIVLDLIFPEAEGWELANSIGNKIPIIFISGELKGPEVIKKCIKMNGVAFMEKPIDPDDLEREIHQALKNLREK